jgi:L-threonylcarbamoyladenylate synthase
MMRKIIQAAAILRSGGLVAFPTETVYGVGADATNAEAVRKIFAVKGRPSTNPLICHVPDEQVAQRYAREWPQTASQLARAFWPGPLTLVLPKTDDIPHDVTAGRDTVALRAPNHALTLMLLRIVDRPLAGPSANKSSHVSPTTAQHVRDELGDEVDMILDGGPCDVGIESTVLDLSGDRPTILRPGGVTREQIEASIGSVEVFSGAVDPAVAAASPGQQEKHYAPHTPAYRFTGTLWADASGAAVILIGAKYRERQIRSARFVEMDGAPQEYARRFYAVLRQLDATAPKAIYIEMPPDEPEWTAVRDRITRATQPLPP